MNRPHLPPLFEPRPCAWLDNLRHSVQPRPATPERDARIEARRFAAVPSRITALGDFS